MTAKRYVKIRFTFPAFYPQRQYTYRDPGLELEPGDLVRVPTRFGVRNAVVVKRTRLPYLFGETKTVLRRQEQ